MKLAMGPEPDQIQELMRGPADTPVVMVNLLRFKKSADTPGEDIPGADAYRRYADRMRRIVEAAGGGASSGPAASTPTSSAGATFPSTSSAWSSTPRARRS